MLGMQAADVSSLDAFPRVLVECAMGIECRLFAVDAGDLQGATLQPALIVGQSMLQGADWCDLGHNWPVIDDLLPLDFLCPASAQEVFQSGRRDSSVPALRILSPAEVISLQHVLHRLTDEELQRQFDHAARTAREDASRPFFVNQRRFDLVGWDQPWETEMDWTLDQAEEFESLAECVDSLREFITQTASQGQGIVIAFCQR